MKATRNKGHLTEEFQNMLRVKASSVSAYFVQKYLYKRTCSNEGQKFN